MKGYKRASSIAEWLDNIYFGYHASLYKKRPIIWHMASDQGSSPPAFGVFCHYHKFDANRMAKLRAGYLRDAIETFRREAALADRGGRTEDRTRSGRPSSKRRRPSTESSKRFRKAIAKAPKVGTVTTAS